MITVVDVVTQIVKSSPFLEEGLTTGLINLSALARKFLPQVKENTKKEVKLGAIIMALKRLKLSLNKRGSQINKIIKNLGDITVRSDLVAFTFTNSKSFAKKQQQLFQKIGNNNTIFCNFSKGVSETTIIISKIIEKDFEDIFKGEKLISRFQNLSSITIKLPPKNVTTPGIYYAILKHLAWENINIIEAFSTSNELTLFFDDKDIEQAFGVFKRLKEK